MTNEKSGQICKFSLITLDSKDRLRYPLVSLFFMMCLCLQIERLVQENLFDIEFVVIIGRLGWSVSVVRFSMCVSVCISVVSCFWWRLPFVSLSSEPGLVSNWRGFIPRLSVFAFSGRPVAVDG